MRTGSWKCRTPPRNRANPEQVNHDAGRFNVITAGNDKISVEYGSGTSWFYKDGRSVGPLASLGISGADALRDTAHVDVIGTFESGFLVAKEVDITFPVKMLNEKVYLGWNDNTIILRFEGDNVVSLRGGRRDAAYFDNAVDPYYSRLTGEAIDTAIVDNVTITARGYVVTGAPGGIEAYWITVGP
jgi:hypothetical protein